MSSVCQTMKPPPASHIHTPTHPHPQVLDLSDNQIGRAGLNAKELPRQLRLLDLRRNPCMAEAEGKDESKGEDVERDGEFRRGLVIIICSSGRVCLRVGVAVL